MDSRPQLRIAGIQLGPHQGDPQKHLDNLVTLFEKAVEFNPAVVCFSELMNAPYFPCTQDNKHFNCAETIDGKTIRAFASLSRKYGTSVIATLFEKKGNKYFNSAVYISPNGCVQGVYRKIHLPKVDTKSCFLDETYYFSHGNEFKIFDLGNTKIGVLICFDRSFPESFRVLGINGVEIVFIPAASSGHRAETFLNELKVRAMENNIFIVAVNKAGEEYLENKPEGIHYFGKSCVIDPVGEIIGKLEDEPNKILVSEIELWKIEEAKAVMDWYKFRRPASYKAISRR